MMKKTKKLLVFLLATICVVGTTGAMTSCGLLFDESSSSDEIGISFKDNFPTHLTLNVSVDISQYVEYEKGTSLTLKAEYTNASGEKKSYETFGTSFMPTELFDVTLTVGVKDTNITITKTVSVKISAPKVLSSETVIRYRGEEFELDSLKEGLNVLAPNNEYTFKATQLTMIGGDETVDLSDLDTYTFVEAGTYEVRYEVYNDGGSTKGTLIVFAKRVLTENEKEDLSNYKEGIVGQSSGRVLVDEEDKAENSDWSYTVWAASNATGVSVFDYSPNYWTNYGMLELEGGIDLSRYYLEFDVKFSKDSRELFSIRMVDEAQTITSNEKVISREGEADENGEYAWQHVSMKDMYKYGTYQYIRFVIMHPLTTDSASYDTNNVWVKFDNVKLCEYDEPYEYHEAVNYVKTDADYTAAEGEFEEKVSLWANMEDDSIPTYLAQNGAYTNEVTEFDFTLEDAEADGYRFVLGARVEETGSYNNGVYLDFRRDAGGAFFAVYTPVGLNAQNYITAQTCQFTSGHNYTAIFGVIDNKIKLIINDNTAKQITLEYEYVLEGVTLPENGGFGFWTYENIEVACKKPHIYTEPTDEAEVTISGFSLGSTNGATGFEVLIGNGTMQKVMVSETNNLSLAAGTFGTSSTWNDRQFPSQVGVIGFTKTAFRFFPTGDPAPQVGDKITVPEGATIIVDGYTVIFGETFEVWYNGETWQMEYVEAPQQPDQPDEPDEPDGATKMTLTALDLDKAVYTSGMYQLYFTVDIVNSGATWAGWDNSASVVLNGNEKVADGWCFASDVLLYVQVTTEEIANPLTIKKGTLLTINDTQYEIAEDFSVYYYNDAWQNEAKVEAKEVTVSDFSFGANNSAGYFDLSIGSGEIQQAIVESNTNLSLAEGTFGQLATWNEDKFPSYVGVLASSSTNLQIFPSNHTATAGEVITIPEGATIIIDDHTLIFGETFKAWFNGEAWQTTEYVVTPPEQPTATQVTITELDTSRTTYADGKYQIYLVMNISQTGATWGGWDNSASVVLNGNEKVADGWCFASDVLLYVQVTTEETANPLTIAKGTALTINDTEYEIAEDFKIYHYDNAFHNVEKTDPKEVTISEFSFGTNNGAGYFDLSIGSGEIQQAIVDSNANLSLAEGTFGQLATWNEDKFPSYVGVLASSAINLQIFPSNHTATAGEVITIPEGATIIVNGYTVIFGEKVEVTFNGTSWEGLGAAQLDPATALTITSLDSTRTLYTNGTYQIYFYTDITNSGATWGGWDNSTTVLLNNTETRADWCFANTGANALLYVQVATTETANPITIKKGTILTIDNTRYEVAEDFHIYYYDGAFYIEPQA